MANGIIGAHGSRDFSPSIGIRRRSGACQCLHSPQVPVVARRVSLAIRRRFSARMPGPEPLFCISVCLPQGNAALLVFTAIVHSSEDSNFRRETMLVIITSTELALCLPCYIYYWSKGREGREVHLFSSHLPLACAAVCSSAPHPPLPHPLPHPRLSAHPSSSY